VIVPALPKMAAPVPLALTVLSPPDAKTRSFVPPDSRTVLPLPTSVLVPPPPAAVPLPAMNTVSLPAPADNSDLPVP